MCPPNKVANTNLIPDLCRRGLNLLPKRGPVPGSNVVRTNTQRSVRTDRNLVLGQRAALRNETLHPRHATTTGVVP